MNNKINVLLVAPNFIEKWNKLELSCKENLSINALSAYLIDKGHNVTTINAQLENWNSKQILEKVKDMKFDLIGVSCSPQKLYLSSKDFIQKARIQYPDALIILGGVFPSLSYKEILSDLPEVDFISTGEGEIALEQLCDYIQNNIEDKSIISGLAYREDENIKLNKANRIENLDSLPFPLRDPRSFGNIKGSYANMIAGRGCYGNCSFCSIHSAYEYNKRICRTPKNVVDEIEELIKKFGVEYIQFHDDIFYDYSPKSQTWLREFINEVTKRKLDFKFRIYLRPNDVRERELLELKKIGLDTVFIGVESGVQRILNEMRKGIIVQQAEEAIGVLRKIGINVCMGFITIVPTMTFEELKENYRFLYRVGSDNDANYHNRLNVYNGCHYEEILSQKGLLLEKENFWDIHSYKFLDLRVQIYHEYLQIIKNFSKPFKQKANNIIATYGEEYSAEVNYTLCTAWIKATKMLLQFVETLDLRDVIEESKVKFIENIFIENENVLNILEKKYGNN